jgi:hypothetical protein
MADRIGGGGRDVQALGQAALLSAGARWKRERIPEVLALRLSMFNEEWEADWRQLWAA